MYIATHNIKNNPDMPREKVVRCAQIIKQKCVAAGLQEIGEGEDVEDVMKGLGPEWDIINESVSTPIVFNTNILTLANARELPPGFQHRGIHRFHRGNARIPTPPRYETFGIFKAVGHPHITPFVLSNGHLINKAWNGRERNEQILRARREYWHEGFDEWQWCVNTYRKAGLTTIITGDFNRLLSGIPPFNAAQFTVATKGIDHIFISKGRGPKADRYHINHGKVKIVNTPSDHPLLVGNVRLLVP